VGQTIGSSFHFSVKEHSPLPATKGLRKEKRGTTEEPNVRQTAPGSASDTREGKKEKGEKKRKEGKEKVFCHGPPPQCLSVKSEKRKSEKGGGGEPHHLSVPKGRRRKGGVEKGKEKGRGCTVDVQLSPLNRQQLGKTLEKKEREEKEGRGTGSPSLNYTPYSPPLRSGGGGKKGGMKGKKEREGGPATNQPPVFRKSPRGKKKKKREGRKERKGKVLFAVS